VRPVLDDRALAVLRQPDTELEQAVALLAALGRDPASMPVGAGDRLLLTMQHAATGRDLELAVACGGCGTTSEVTLGPDTMPGPHPRSAWWGPGGGLREPTYGDLYELPTEPDLAAAELLRRCTVGRPPRPAGPEELERVDDSLSGPLVFACSGCGEQVECAVDVQTVALRGLLAALDAFDAEVHLLAKTYQWDLASIETLPRQRRRRLAELIADDR
jgi:hypothetical protein